MTTMKPRLSDYVLEMRRLGAMLSQPLIAASTNGGRSTDHMILRHPSSCHAKRTHIVEIMTPLFLVRAWQDVWKELISLIPSAERRSNICDIDMHWCYFLKQKYPSSQPCIVFNTSIVHYDTHSIERFGSGVTVTRSRTMPGATLIYSAINRTRIHTQCLWG